METAELRLMIAELVACQKETDQRQKETAAQQKVTDRQLKETDRQLKETDRQLRRQLKELGKQIGGLGDKFGSFAEGFAFNSIAKVLRKDFGMTEYLSPGVRVRRDGEEQEYDILAYSNGSKNEAMIVEIKSKLRSEDIDQMARKMESVKKMLPEHADKSFFGMICYVAGDSDLKKAVIRKGWYLAQVADEVFQLENVEGFEPRAY